MNDHMPDYRWFPKDRSQQCLSEAIEALRKEFSNALNTWLKECVWKHCPEAIEAYDSGDSDRALRSLKIQDFYYSCLPDNRYRFMRGDQMLEECQIAWTIKASVGVGVGMP